MIIHTCHAKSNGNFANSVGRGVALGTSLEAGKFLAFLIVPGVIIGLLIAIYLCALAFPLVMVIGCIFVIVNIGKFLLDGDKIDFGNIPTSDE